MLYQVFIDRLFETYVNSWKTENKALLMERYAKVLNNPRIDFEKLDNWINSEWHSNFMPTPAELKQASLKCLKYERSDKFIHIVARNTKTGVKSNRWAFPYGTTEEQMVAVLNKTEPLKDENGNFLSWEILEVWN